MTAVSKKINYNDLCYLVFLYFDRKSSILKVKLKEFHYRAGQALMVPGG
jgi:hypothetical protein